MNEYPRQQGKTVMKDTVIKLIGLVETHSGMITSHEKMMNKLRTMVGDVNGNVEILAEVIHRLEKRIEKLENDRTSP